MMLYGHVLFTHRVVVCNLVDLVGSPLSVQARKRIVELCADITASTDMLLQWGCCREAGRVLLLTGKACRKAGERLQGRLHQEYILKVCEYRRHWLCLSVFSTCSHCGCIRGHCMLSS